MDYTEEFINIEKFITRYSISINEILDYWYQGKIFLYIKLNAEPAYFEYIESTHSNEQFEYLIKKFPEEFNPLKGLHSISNFTYSNPIVINNIDNDLLRKLIGEGDPNPTYNYQIAGKASGYWLVLPPIEQNRITRFLCKTQNKFINNYENNNAIKVLKLEETTFENEVSKISCIRNQNDLDEQCHLMNLEAKKNIRHQLLFKDKDELLLKDFCVSFSALKNLYVQNKNKLKLRRKKTVINKERYNFANVAIHIMYKKCHEITKTPFTGKNRLYHLQYFAETNGIKDKLQLNEATVCRWFKDITPKKKLERNTTQKLKILQMMISICFNKEGTGISPTDVASELTLETQKMTPPVNIKFTEKLIIEWLN